MNGRSYPIGVPAMPSAGAGSQRYEDERNGVRTSAILRPRTSMRLTSAVPSPACSAMSRWFSRVSKGAV